MAIIEEPLALPAGEPGPAVKPLGVFTRPRETTGLTTWLTTVDHKRIGIMYGAAAMFFLVIGGVAALLIRIQLATPNNTFLSGDAYNRIFTMHGTVMVFLVVMPIGAAFANYMMPIQVGARDVAFPRINAFSFWVFFLGGLMLNTSWFLGGGANGGWFNYAPNNGIAFSPSTGIDYWSIGLLIVGFGSLTGAINLITTVINLRAPGMSLMKMPVFVWMTLVTQFLLLFAIPVLTVAQLLLIFDRIFDANFFNVAQGADPLLWQHLFWVFGHPEVYLMILPAFGIVSEVIPTFARKPIFGYPFMVFSGVAIGFMGWGVWAHHMFVAGIGPLSVTAFSVATMFIAVPTGVKILNWMATLWGGRLILNTAMLFAIGLVTQFTIGGLSGVSHAIAPSDTQQTDTYYIVAHFHYVLFGGALFGFMSGLYFWWPKVFGHKLDEKIGKWNFWLMVVGFNVTFGPMHILGLQGMPRRMQTYDTVMGFNFWNMIATIGSFVLAVGTVLVLWNALVSYRRWKAAGSPNVGPDPWDGRTLEWSVQSPTPEHNFDESPAVTSLDDFWHRKYVEDENGQVRRVATGDELAQPGNPEGVHLPAPSYWPFVLAAALPIIGYGLIYNLWLIIPGALLVMTALYGWALEPADDLDLPDDHGHGGDDDDHDDGGPPGGAAEELETVQ
ncbi:MAG: cytochrome c oxidase subunit I [Acidimicrobiia bacterium]|nr:cytochrome c oxidase subunit I [Acidimicrobiia bacterium]